MADEQLLRCADCRSVMRRVEEVLHPVEKVRMLEFYQCTSDPCQRKLVLQWERPDGRLTDEDLSFVEREVLNRGYWWPSEAGGGGFHGS